MAARPPARRSDPSRDGERESKRGRRQENRAQNEFLFRSRISMPTGLVLYSATGRSQNRITSFIQKDTPTFVKYELGRAKIRVFPKIVVDRISLHYAWAAPRLPARPLARLPMAWLLLLVARKKMLIIRPASRQRR